MRTSAPGSDVAPTLHRFAGRCPPRGLISLGAARREIALLFMGVGLSFGQCQAQAKSDQAQASDFFQRAAEHGVGAEALGQKMREHH